LEERKAGGGSVEFEVGEKCRVTKLSSYKILFSVFDEGSSINDVTPLQKGMVIDFVTTSLKLIYFLLFNY